jgi:hypothetical protein
MMMMMIVHILLLHAVGFDYGSCTLLCAVSVFKRVLCLRFYSYGERLISW